MVTHTCNPRTQEARAEGLFQVGGLGKIHKVSSKATWDIERNKECRESQRQKQRRTEEGRERREERLITFYINKQNEIISNILFIIRSVFKKIFLLPCSLTM